MNKLMQKMCFFLVILIVINYKITLVLTVNAMYVKFIFFIQLKKLKVSISLSCGKDLHLAL